MNDFDKLLLSELNMVGYVPSADKDSLISDEDMCAALTLNENLGSLGYTLAHNDICAIATSESRDDLYKNIKSMLPDVKAKPMYPDFPKQVMGLSEAEFRFHQILHYFSTYGMEFYTGKKVSKGWLPSVEDTKKSVNDKRLVDLTVIKLVDENEKYEYALKRILGKTEPMTIPEQDIIMHAIKEVEPHCIENLKVKYKDNIPGLFDRALELDRENSLKAMHAICQHAGDALDNIYRILKNKKFHLKTSEKRTFVKLLEMYSVPNFRGNLILSRKLRERNLQILQGLDYNMYSRSAAHKHAVDELRDDNLKSWASIATRKLVGKEEDALAFVSKHPGEMLRMVNWILSLGYDPEEIEKYLSENPMSFNTRTLVKVLTNFLNASEAILRQEAERKVNDIRWKYEALADKLSLYSLGHQRAEEIIAATRKIDAIVEKRRQLANSFDCKKTYWELWNINGRYFRELEGARKKETTVTYETSKDKVELEELKRQKKEICREMKKMHKGSINEKSIDKKLGDHYGVLKDAARAGKIRSRKRKITNIKQYNVLKEKNEKITNRINVLLKTGQLQPIRNEVHLDVSDIVSEITQKWSYEKAIAWEKVKEIEREKQIALDEFDLYNKPEIDNIENQIENIRKKYEIKMKPDNIERELKALDAKEESEIKTVYEIRDRRINGLWSGPVKNRILSNVLKKHLGAINTQLRDKKVYLDDAGFDLNHSVFSMKDKSDDGGFIPSGIAYKIPDEAKYVRFFVYWNDKERVDVDLHANGERVDGGYLHIGWNGGYNESGVIHSGDITHSDAAEYIDVDLSKPVKRIFTNVHLFSGKSGLDKIEECYVGMMAVNEIGEEVKLYDRANCFFSHEMHQNTRSLLYGYIDVQNRYVKFIGKPNTIGTEGYQEDDSKDVFTIGKYLRLLFEEQGVELVDTPEDAEVILSVGKSPYENGISLIDESFFMDAG